MDRAAVAETVIGMVSKINGRNANHFDEKTNLHTIGFDSLECIYFTADVEDEFGIEIHCGERVSIETVGDMVDLVLQKKGVMPAADMALAA